MYLFLNRQLSINSEDSNSLLSVLGKLTIDDRLNLPAQGWRFLDRCGPNYRPVDSEVRVDNHIAETYDISPWNFRKTLAKILWQPRRRLAYYSKLVQDSAAY